MSFILDPFNLLGILKIQTIYKEEKILIKVNKKDIPTCG